MKFDSSVTVKQDSREKSGVITRSVERSSADSMRVKRYLGTFIVKFSIEIVRQPWLFIALSLSG